MKLIRLKTGYQWMNEWMNEKNNNNKKIRTGRKKKRDNTEASHMVTHYNTNSAWTRLTFPIGREGVHSC